MRDPFLDDERRRDVDYYRPTPLAVCKHADPSAGHAAAQGEADPKPMHEIQTALTPLDRTQLDALLAYWDAANYLTAAQIYLRDNPLLREPLRAEHIKPRLLGHWGTSPG